MLKKIVLFLLVFIILFWLIIALAGFHFYSIDIPTKIPWILLLLIGIYLFISFKKRINKITIAIVFPLLLIIYIPVMWWFGYFLIIGIEGDIKITDCKCCDKKVISYTHQRYGMEQHKTSGIGETYLGGLIYKTNNDTTYMAFYSFAEEIDANILLPKNVDPKDLVFIWQSQELVFVFKNSGNNLCLPLQYQAKN